MINYYRPDKCEAFEGIVFDFPEITFFQPSPEKAPWHVQAAIDYGFGHEPAVLNFWPHKMKGQRQGEYAVQGEADLRKLIETALKDAREEPFDVFEGVA